LDTLKSLSYNEDVEDLKMLEDMPGEGTFRAIHQVTHSSRKGTQEKPNP
jgi:hypothetical protein